MLSCAGGVKNPTPNIDSTSSVRDLWRHQRAFSCGGGVDLRVVGDVFFYVVDDVLLRVVLTELYLFPSTACL